MITRIEAGSIIITPSEAAILYQLLPIKQTRERNRVGNNAAHDLLTEITRCAFHSSAGSGNEPRQDTASEERSSWTTQQVAKAAGVSERKVRDDALAHRVAATRTTAGWLFTETAAQTYIQSSKRN